jgi:hypothetical protein
MWRTDQDRELKGLFMSPTIDFKGNSNIQMIGAITDKLFTYQIYLTKVNMPIIWISRMVSSK